MILLAINIAVAECEKAKATGFADTVIMKPLRVSMVAACLQQVLGISRKNQHGNDVLNKSVSKRGLLSGKKMLVVDDNVVNRRVAAGALKKLGAEVHCAASGHEALKMLQIPHEYSACFMDIQMPEMDGYCHCYSFAMLATWYLSYLISLLVRIAGFRQLLLFGRWSVKQMHK